MITRFHHVASVVPNLEAGVAVWRDRFGLEVELEATVPEQGVRACLLPCGDGEIELLEALDPENPIGRYLAKGGGIHHVCWESSDVAEELNRLQAEDIRVIDKVPRPGLAGRIGFLHPKSTLSTLIELATPGGGVETHDYAEPHPPADPTFKVTGVDSLVFACADPGVAAATFSANFGFVADDAEYEIAELGVAALRIRLPNADVWLAHMGDRPEGAQVLGLRVESLEPGVGKLRSDGVAVVDATDAEGHPVAIIPGDASFGVTVTLRTT